MTTLDFYKYQGTGNDFVMIDNRDLTFPKETEIIKRLCDRRFGIGGDGLILLENADEGDFKTDFKMVYYNSDGNESFRSSGNGDLLEVIYKVYGKDVSKNSIKVEKLKN